MLTGTKGFIHQDGRLQIIFLRLITNNIQLSYIIVDRMVSFLSKLKLPCTYKASTNPKDRKTTWSIFRTSQKAGREAGVIHFEPGIPDVENLAGF
jgi:hypothetical protein